MFVIVGYGTATTLASIFQCTPIRKAWIPSTPGHCINVGATWYAVAALAITTDIALIILPVREVLKLNLPKTQKIALVMLFGLGIL
jgi:hypothetical protein